MFETFPTLHTGRFDLVEITHEHLRDILKLFGNDEVTRFYNLHTMTSETEALKLITWFHSRFQDKAGIRWGVSFRGHKEIIGTIGFNKFTRRQKANVGYELHPDFWNKGYLTEILKVVVEYGFKELDIDRIEAEVMQGNAASERVLAKAGFTREGVLRHWMYWDNKHYDMTMFSLLQSELI